MLEFYMPLMVVPQRKHFDHVPEIQLQVVSELVQQNFHTLQNPEDCKNAKVLTCQLSGGLQGFGNIMHRFIYCFNVGYYLNRTVIIGGERWKYGDDWDEVFEPISETCPKTSAVGDEWPGLPDSQNILSLVDELIKPYPNGPVLRIPAELQQVVKRFHKDPNIWWVGQIVKYLFKPGSWAASEIKSSFYDKIGNQPVVGIHVRRSDKFSELIGLPVYMDNVKEFYLMLEKVAPVPVKFVFVATDELELLNEIRQAYPEYTFIGSESRIRSAEKIMRSTTESLKGIILDVVTLAHCDLTVCMSFRIMIMNQKRITRFGPPNKKARRQSEKSYDINFSKNGIVIMSLSMVCSFTYEYKQTRAPEYFEMFRSVDVPYHYHKQLHMRHKQYFWTKMGNITAAMPIINAKRLTMQRSVNY
ncbi:Alpha-(1,6)-fucosyltransferase [Nymphon striatum]|nr:Alpha-(1,6)-fucosyltransferase [Nymphon striatum]